MRLVLATALATITLAGAASASIILTETNCPEGQYVALVTNESTGFGTSGICVPVSEKPFQIKFDDGRVEGFDTKDEYNLRRDELESSIEG